MSDFDTELDKISQFAHQKVDPVLKPLLEDLLTDRPSDVPTFMIDWLVKFREDQGSTPPLCKTQQSKATSDSVQSFTHFKLEDVKHSTDMPELGDTSKAIDPRRYSDSMVEDDRPMANPMRRRTAISAEPVQMMTGPISLPAYAKSDGEKQRIVDFISEHMLFSALDSKQLEEMVGAMQKKTFTSGTDIIVEGDCDGEFFYIVDSGEVDCFVRKQNGRDELVKVYEKGESFGELALMYNTPRKATIRARSDCVLWALDRVAFKSLLMNTTNDKHRRYEGLLRKVPLLEPLHRSEISKIADALVIKHFHDGEYAVAQGDLGNEFFIIAEGTATVCKQYEENGALIDIAELSVGDFFGEVALVTDNPRRASVVAKGLMTCLVLDRDAFNRLLGPISEILKRTEGKYEEMERKVYQEKLDMIRGLQSPERPEETDIEPTVRRYSHRRRTAVSAEPLNIDNFIDHDEELPVFDKTETQKDRIRTAISKNFLFSALEAQQTVTVIDAMFEKSFEDGEVIIKQGDEGDYFYVLDEGRADCFVDKEKEGSTLVRQFNAGEGFGDLALMYNCPRSATIIAKGKVSVWAVDRKTFRRLLMDTTAKKRRNWEHFVANISVLKSLDRYDRAKLVDSLTEHTFEDGQYVIREGEIGDAFYIIEEGCAKVTKSFPHSDAPIHVHDYTIGDYFGELSLLRDQPRAANVIASGKLKLLRLDRSSFVTLMGPHEDLLKQNISLYQAIDERAHEPDLDIME